jgi:fused signal recognition particle receptor
MQRTAAPRAQPCARSGQAALPRPPPARHIRARRGAAAGPCCAGPSLLQKLGRVLQEKVAADVERLTQGASKTRDRLGVRFSLDGTAGRISARTFAARRAGCPTPTLSTLTLIHPPSPLKKKKKQKVVDELLAYWTLETSEDALEELEEALIAADFGPRTALRVVDGVRDEVRAGRAAGPADLKAALKRSVMAALTPKPKADGSDPAALDLGAAEDSPPAVVMIVGVNGGGKTTTLGKLAARLGGAGGRVMLAAGDTYRAAAAEQLAGWAKRAGCEFYGGGEDGGVPSSSSAPPPRPDAVLFRAVGAAREAGCDVLLCDTSGRLHNNPALMAELAKCARSLGRAAPGAPHETLLVLDGTTGLNMVSQAREFNETVPLSGLVVTKLDGSARGGAVVGAVAELGVPIKFVGVGEGVDDLQAFDAAAFVDALFPDDG